MKKYFFSDISEFVNSYKQTIKLDTDELKETYEALIIRLDKKQALGFYKRKNNSLDDKILNIISEQNADISAKDRNRILEFYKFKIGSSEIRRIFFMRVFISVTIISVALFYISFNNELNQDFVKALFGLIGVVIGYWFK